jgi:ribosomal protein S18 acetylase RimI-like enzyme
LLLGHNFSTPLTPPLRPTRKGRRSDWSEILAIDEKAFPEFWRFDRPALLEAIKATPTTRVRVNTQDPLTAFAITGRSGRLAFLQRLAVHPQHQRSGIGRSLVADALLWSKRRFVSELLVNTQIENVGAKELYESMGFSKKNVGLAVLQWSADT